MAPGSTLFACRYDITLKIKKLRRSPNLRLGSGDRQGWGLLADRPQWAPNDLIRALLRKRRREDVVLSHILPTPPPASLALFSFRHDKVSVQARVYIPKIPLECPQNTPNRPTPPRT